LAALLEEHARLVERYQHLKSEQNRLSARCDELKTQLHSLLDRCHQIGAQIEQLRAGPVRPENVLEKMRTDWDDRARLNANYYTNSAKYDWSDEEYFETGEINVREHILTDITDICQGDDPGRMRILEIGCGAGRMTKALARLFGEVHAVDISSEMIGIARRNLAGVSNAFFYNNNGMDLSVIPDQPFDFAFSFIVFQHIPSPEVIESYLREVHRLLKPGRLFKFQVQGCRPAKQERFDTWLGVAFDVQEMRNMAARCGFEMRYWHGEGTQYFWLWFFKTAQPA